MQYFHSLDPLLQSLWLIAAISSFIYCLRFISHILPAKAARLLSFSYFFTGGEEENKGSNFFSFDALLLFMFVFSWAGILLSIFFLNRLGVLLTAFLCACLWLITRYFIKYR